VAYEQLKDRIKESPVSLVISHYVTLTKRGSAQLAICPFHNDTKPSMNVNDARGMYKCFACGAGGDAIRFVMDFKKLEFVEALREIAGVLGLPFEEQKEKRKNPKVEMAFRVLNASMKIYRKVAAQTPKTFTDFLEKRKLSAETVEKWQIGYAPRNNVLLKYLDSLPGADGELARNVALEIKIVRHNEERNSFYDFFRDRVMFPIHDHGGQVRGYSGRAVLPEQQQKYMNSFESFVFDKGSILFGFFFAKTPIRQADRAILVEGNIDVITMHQFGFTETIGTMGTALSDASVRLLSNLTKHVYLGLDSDAAGKKAMQRINADFLPLGILPRYLTFEPHKDPDEFLLKEGRLALLERIEKAPIYLDVLIQEQFPEKIPENTDVKLNILQQVFAVVSPLKEHLSATERVVNAAKSLNLRSDPATILESYREFLSRQKERAPQREERPKLAAVEETIEVEIGEARNLQGEMPSQVLPPPTKSERLVLKEILCHPEFLTHLKVDEFLATIGHDEVKRLIQWLVKIYLEIDDAEYVSIVQDELQYGGYSKSIFDIGTDALFQYGNRYSEKVIQRMLNDYLLMLRMDQLKLKRKALVEKQKATLLQFEVDAIMTEIAKLDKEILHLKNTDS
jgi:DNA primase